MTGPILSLEALSELARVCLKNADSLLEDARILLDAERWPRAHVLTVIALEELARTAALLTADPIGQDPGAAPSRSAGAPATTAGDSLISHDFISSLIIGDPLDARTAELWPLRALLDEDVVIETLGLKVGFRGGRPWTPDLIDGSRARNLHVLAMTVRDHVGVLWSGDPETAARLELHVGP